MYYGFFNTQLKLLVSIIIYYIILQLSTDYICNYDLDDISLDRITVANVEIQSELSQNAILMRHSNVLYTQ